MRGKPPQIIGFGRQGIVICYLKRIVLLHIDQNILTCDVGLEPKMYTIFNKFRHESGVANLHTSLNPRDLYVEEIHKGNTTRSLLPRGLYIPVPPPLPVQADILSKNIKFSMVL